MQFYNHFQKEIFSPLRAENFLLTPIVNLLCLRYSIFDIILIYLLSYAAFIGSNFFFSFFSISKYIFFCLQLPYSLQKFIGTSSLNVLMCSFCTIVVHVSIPWLNQVYFKTFFSSYIFANILKGFHLLHLYYNFIQFFFLLLFYFFLHFSFYKLQMFVVNIL